MFKTKIQGYNTLSSLSLYNRSFYLHLVVYKPVHMLRNQKVLEIALQFSVLLALSFLCDHTNNFPFLHFSISWHHISILLARPFPFELDFDDLSPSASESPTSTWTTSATPPSTAATTRTTTTATESSSNTAPSSSSSWLLINQQSIE